MHNFDLRTRSQYHRPSAVGVEVVRQGPKGEQGETGIAGALVFTAGLQINGHRVVKQTSHNTVTHANPLIENDAELLVGISLNAAAQNGPVTVVTQDTITDPSFNWIAGLPLFCGLDGQLTQTPPAAPMLWDCCVGVAVSTNTIQVAIEPPIFLE